jgi:hypothetical protein
VIDYNFRATAGEAADALNAEWKPAPDAPENVIVMTKIDDGKGIRNVTTLKRRGNLWWFPDDSMYCYYRPTHFRPHPRNQ